MPSCRHHPRISRFRKVDVAYSESMEFQRISTDPGVCEGKARVKDTRMTVEFVLKLLGAGYTAEDVVREYRVLELADVYECATFGASRR